MKAEDIFLVALDKQSPAERKAYLDGVCGDDAGLRAHVEGLLHSHQEAGSFLDAPLFDSPPTIDQPVIEKAGTVIGPYKLLQQVGEGGFGVVFMAEQQAPVRRKVALKVIKPGMDTRQVIARFEAERQALAMMDHPHIARVMDAGATASGRPYFVMELVRGVPITAYCDQNNLPVRERLQLFASVCQAIQHAHQKGIIHRDIKPSNVLVTSQDGTAVVKVIDFGVAKAMGQQLTDKTLFTDFAQMIGTPLYMSPEQAELSGTDIDTRSDIYSLGVLLYELLTGSTPVDKEKMKQAAFDEIRRIIREDEPPKPSTRISSAEAAPSIAAQRHTEPVRLAKIVRGELDWIVMKALEKDRNRRYETANAFARDIEHFLHDEPVLACPPSAWYRLTKFSRRNKVALVMVATVALALLAGTVVSAWQAVRANRAEKLAQTRLEAERDARREAESNLGKAREAVDRMLTRVAEERLIDVPWMEPTRKALLEDAVQFYEQLLAERNTDPEIRLATAKAHAKLGWIHARFFKTPEEQAAYRRAGDLLEPLVKEFPQELRYRAALANVFNLQSKSIAWNRNRWQEAKQLLTRAIDLQESVGTATLDSAQNAYDLSSMVHLMGCVLQTGNQPEQAMTSWRRALTISEAVTKEQPNHAAHLLLQIVALDNIANVLKRNNQGQAEELLLRAQALATRFQALPDTKAVFDATARSISDVEIALGRLYQEQGRFKEAEPVYRRGVAILEKYAADYPGVRLYQSWLANGLNKLGWFLLADHRPAEAEPIFRRAWQLGAELFHERMTQNETLAEWSLTGLEGLGQALQEQARSQEALQLYGQAAKLLNNIQEEFSDSPNAWPTLAKAYKNLGDSLTNADDRLLAEEAYEQAIRIYSKLVAEFPDRAELQSHLDSTLQALARRYHSLGSSLKETHHLPEAEQAFRHGIAVLDKAPKDLLETSGKAIRSAIAENYHTLGVLLADSNREPEAVEAFRQAIAFREQMPNKLATRNALAYDYFHLFKTLQKVDKLDEAVQACRQRVAILQKATTDFPDAIQLQHRQALGWSYSDLAVLLRKNGPHEDAAEAHRKAIAVFEILTAEFPDRADYRQSLDNNRQRLASLLKLKEKAPESNSK